MLHIILLILKIIGIVVLCLLGLLLLCLCLILFVPIFFEAELEKEDSFRAKGRLSWLGIGLRAGFQYEEELEFSLRIFGIRIFPSGKKKKKSKKESKENKESDSVSIAKRAEEQKGQKNKKAENPDHKEPAKETEPSRKAEPEKQAEQSEKAKSEKQAEPSEKAKSEKETEQDKNSEPGVQEEKKRRFGRLLKKKRKKEKKKKEKSAFFSELKKILSDERCREGIVHTMSYLITFFQAVRMKDAEGKVDFSMGAPDLTGKTLGLISMFPFAYGKDLEINPDFMADNSYFTGRIGLKGSLQLVYLLIFIVRMGMDKEVRKVIVSLMGKK